MISDAIINYLKDGCTLTTQIYWGKVAAAADYSAGVVRLQELPGSGTNDTTQKGFLIFQVSVWHTNLYEAGRIKAELQALIRGYCSVLHGPLTDDDDNQFRVVLRLPDGGDLGEFEEDLTVGDTAATVWQKPFQATCSYINRFVR